METVRVSSDYQVVIPRDVRQRLSLTPGQRLQVIVHDGRLELLPIRDIGEMRGFLAGIEVMPDPASDEDD